MLFHGLFAIKHQSVCREEVDGLPLNVSDTCFCCSTQVRLTGHNSRGGAEAPEGSLHKWPSLRSVIPGVLGGLGQARPAVPAVLVSVRRLSHHGGPSSQRPAGRPRRVRR